MTCHRPFLFGQQLRNIFLDLHGIGIPRPSEPPGKPVDVGVDGDSWDIEGVAEDDIGGFPADSREAHEVFQIRRNFRIEAFDESLPHACQRFRLCPEKSQGAEDRLKMLTVGVRIGLRGRIFSEQLRGDRIDTHICRLG